MTDMQGPGITPGGFAGITPRQPEASGPSRAAGAPSGASPAQESGAAGELRARLAEISAQAREVQLAAGTAMQASDVLSGIEQALAFALDAAREAQNARSLPEVALAQLQKQVDLAITTVDGLASEASFAGRRLFDGTLALEASGRRLDLPKISAHNLGSSHVRALPETSEQDERAPGIDYSKSVASAGTDGPNSLAFWADGAVTVMQGALAQVGRIAQSIEAFRRDAIAPAARNIDVTMANALAVDTGRRNLDEIVILLTEVRRDMADKGAPGSAAPTGEGVIKLLD